MGENVMSNLRQWQLDSTSPFSLQIAADIRLSQTDSSDDQVWEVLLNTGESTALALQTRYGGRAGLASIVPMWLHDGQVIYQTQTYAKSPVVTAFAPSYLRIEAGITQQLSLIADYWAMESHAVGARFTLANTSTSAIEVRLDLLGFVGMSGKEQKLIPLPLPDGGIALSLGIIGNLYPVVVLEGSSLAPGESPSKSKIGRTVTVESGQKITLRWVHAARPDAQESLGVAQKWLLNDWEAAFAKIDSEAQSSPIIETGNPDWDTTIAFAFQQLVQAFLKPPGNLPHASLASVRQPGRGFGEADRGQLPTSIYLATLAVASVNANLAQGIIRNYLASQRPDGWIDLKPGLLGQQKGSLCTPVLARLAWGIFQYTEDSAFLQEVFPGLLKFFERWLQADLDADKDGAPEWQNESQSGYTFTPTFATWQSWGQGADIRLVETPDLTAYLLSEAKSLREIAYYLRDEALQKQLDERIAILEKSLETFWSSDEKRFRYRDRDTHETAGSTRVVEDARGMDDMIPAVKLDTPNRLIVRVSGGMDLTPQMTVRLAGFNHLGQAVNEEAKAEQFVWSHGRGVYTSQVVFSQIDKITFEGLSRVYRVDVHTIDTTRSDIHSLIPLWSAGIPAEHAAATIATLTNPEHFWRTSGVSMCPANDPNFDPANRNGSGGVWPFWLTLMGEGLIENNEMPAARDLLIKILDVQTAILKDKKVFSEFYHSDQAIGLGESGHIDGIVPLHLLMRVIGVRVISPTKVWAGGAFTWEQPITIRQHGITVQRSSRGTHIDFPSGHQVDLTGNDWQEVIDPTSTTSQTSNQLTDVKSE
jgi:hypothetical protein